MRRAPAGDPAGVAVVWLSLTGFVETHITASALPICAGELLLLAVTHNQQSGFSRVRRAQAPKLHCHHLQDSHREPQPPRITPQEARIRFCRVQHAVSKAGQSGGDAADGATADWVVGSCHAQRMPLLIRPKLCMPAPTGVLVSLVPALSPSSRLRQFNKGTLAELPEHSPASHLQICCIITVLRMPDFQFHNVWVSLHQLFNFVEQVIPACRATASAVCPAVSWPQLRSGFLITNCHSSLL